MAQVICQPRLLEGIAVQVAYAGAPAQVTRIDPLKSGAVDSTRYNTVSMVGTIEDILGIPSFNLNDASAMPMANAFDLREKKWDYKPTPSQLLATTTLPIPALGSTSSRPTSTGIRDMGACYVIRDTNPDASKRTWPDLPDPVSSNPQCTLRLIRRAVGGGSHLCSRLVLGGQ